MSAIDAEANVRGIRSWDEFEGELENLRARREQWAVEGAGEPSDFLYRGQPDSSDKLRTTLERLVGENIPLTRYYDFVWVIKAKIESVTGKRWPIPTREEYEQWCSKQNSATLLSFPGGEYLAYLRHHGFPSPLLDWSRSPYVAAHFAMVETPRTDVPSVAVYAYLESPRGGKWTDTCGPAIQSLGPYVTTHKRHYIQQSTYTVCTKCAKGHGTSLCYAPHEEVLCDGQGKQDLLWKLVIPIGERKAFLSRLEMMNVNSFSLFETDDKLMEHIYISEVLLGGHLQPGRRCPEVCPPAATAQE